MRPLINHGILVAGVIFLLTPLVMILASSTHETARLSSEGLQLWPGTSGVENYTKVLTSRRGFSDEITAAGMLRNSLIVGTGVAVLTTVFSMFAAYSVVYFKYRAAVPVFWVILITILFPLESRFIDTFQVVSHLGLINSYTGMILPALACGLGTLFFRQFFRTIPEEYLEAAILDGAGPVRFFVDFILPLSWKRAGAVFVVSFMIGWNQYLWPLMISTDESHYTIVRGIRLIGQESGTGMALAFLSILPPFLLVLGFQRWFFKGLAD